MHIRMLVFFVIVFLSGLGAGWFGKSLSDASWINANYPGFIASVPDAYDSNSGEDIQGADVATVVVSASFKKDLDADRIVENEVVESASSTSVNPANISTQKSQQYLEYETRSISIDEIFSGLLEDRLYNRAIAFYEEQKQISGKIANQLRNTLLDELDQLSDRKNNADFSALIESYLSVYYDDIDVLLLLADFNQTNGYYIEVVDAYLLAKTYAYSNVDQENVVNRFNRFVEVIDGSYTGQKNWPFLIEFYSHVQASGLMTSLHQYRQALAYLRSGDEVYAVEQLSQLVNDSIVGKSAEKALKNLNNDTEIPVIVSSSPLEGADSIALQKLGNQYAADLTNNRQDSAKLLIDTGASMTALSRASFDRLNVNGDAVEQGQRVFRTANGPVQGAVFSMPELALGPYILQDTQVAVIDFDSARGIDGLLGMNILGQFRFHIEQEQSRLLLSRK